MSCSFRRGKMKRRKKPNSNHKISWKMHVPINYESFFSSTEKSPLSTDININQLNCLYLAYQMLGNPAKSRKKLRNMTSASKKKLFVKPIIWHIDAEIDSQYWAAIVALVFSARQINNNKNYIIIVMEWLFFSSTHQTRSLQRLCIVAVAGVFFFISLSFFLEKMLQYNNVTCLVHRYNASFKWKSDWPMELKEIQ